MRVKAGRDCRHDLLSCFGVGVVGQLDGRGAVRLLDHLGNDASVVLVGVAVFLQSLWPFKAARAEMTFVMEVSSVPSEMQLHLPFVPEALVAGRALERRFTSVPTNVNVIP